MKKIIKQFIICLGMLIQANCVQSTNVEDTWWPDVSGMSKTKRVISFSYFSFSDHQKTITDKERKEFIDSIRSTKSDNDVVTLYVNKLVSSGMGSDKVEKLIASTGHSISYSAKIDYGLHDIIGLGKKSLLGSFSSNFWSIYNSGFVNWTLDNTPRLIGYAITVKMLCSFLPTVDSTTPPEFDTYGEYKEHYSGGQCDTKEISSALTKVNECIEGGGHYENCVEDLEFDSNLMLHHREFRLREENGIVEDLSVRHTGSGDAEMCFSAGEPGSDHHIRICGPADGTLRGASPARIEKPIGSVTAKLTPGKNTQITTATNQQGNSCLANHKMNN